MISNNQFSHEWTQLGVPMLELLSSGCEVVEVFLGLESRRNQAKERKVIVRGMVCPRAIESVF